MTAKDKSVLLNANTRMQFVNAVKFCKFYYNAVFPNADISEHSFDDCKKCFHGNSKLLLHCFYNAISHQYEMQMTTKSIEKSHGAKHDFFGTMNAYANNLWEREHHV